MHFELLYLVGFKNTPKLERPINRHTTVQECLDRTFCASAFSISRFPRFSFFLFFGTHLGDNFHCYGYCSCTVAAQFYFSVFFNISVDSVYYLRDLQTSLFNNFLLKMGYIVLFTYLKIILLQCF